MATGQAGAEIGIGTTLNCNHEAPIVAHTLRGEGFDASEDGTGRGIPLVAATLVSNGDAHSGFRDDNGLIPVAVRMAQTSANGCGISEGVAHTLDSANGQAIVFDPTQITSALNYSYPKPGHPCHPLASSAHAPVMATAMAVRRLTPRECERLQGFPDDYTKINEKTPDGPRYKALGNSMAVPVMRWIGERIAAVDAIAMEGK